LGSDIHLFIEYRDKSAEQRRWWSFGGRISVGRDYRIFERLAGVRGELANAIVPPRGFPADAAEEAKDENFLWIDYSGKEENPWSPTCTPEDAAQWVNSGKSKYFGTTNKVAMAVDLKGEKEPELVNVQRPERVSQPDCHTHSWLSLEEFESALHATGQPVPKTYAACVAAMRSLEKDGCEVRAVFWFDN
jgi:hypothetical protein